MKPNLDKVMFFDIEVFKYDAFVCFKKEGEKKYTFFHNDFTSLVDFIKGYTLIGFNNEYYDNHILTAMLNGNSVHQIKELNDRIISGEKIRNYNRKFPSLDMFQQISVSFPSLKKIEGNLGKKILESSVDFTIDRKLTEEELKESFGYCAYDTAMVEEIYKMRKESYVVTKLQLAEMIGNDKAVYWNNTTASANLLTDKPLVKWSNIRVPEEMMDMVPPDVKELWLEKDKGSITTTEFDNDIVWAFGGLHSTNNKKKVFKDVVLLDVALT